MSNEILKENWKILANMRPGQHLKTKGIIGTWMKMQGQSGSFIRISDAKTHHFSMITPSSYVIPPEDIIEVDHE